MRKERNINDIVIGKCKFEAMLEDISPDCSREAWVRVGRAIYDASKGEDYGLAVFHRWSRRGKKHKRFQEIEAVWLSFRMGEKIPYPVGTLAMLGAEAGEMYLDDYVQIFQYRMAIEDYIKNKLNYR